MSLRRPTAERSVIFFQYKPFMWCCPDARLRHVKFIFFPSRQHFRHPIGLQLFYFGFREDNRPASLLIIMQREFII